MYDYDGFLVLLKGSPETPLNINPSYVCGEKPPGLCFAGTKGNNSKWPSKQTG